MPDWTAGYVTEIGYTPGYYPELNPLRLQLAFLNAGLVPPVCATACELGFGQGMSVNLHAAASVNQWFGADFNPAQAGFAQELAAVSGASARLFDQSFAEFCTRADLPEFDFIGLHGVWSWIGDESRRIIVDFVRRKLKVGGVFYISYNTSPGWATIAPIRDLLTDHEGVMGAPGQGILSRIDGALLFTEKLLATKPIYAQVHPHVVEWLKTNKGRNRNYLAHEYFNRDWLPMSFARVADWLAPAKLNFACSANYPDLIDALNLTGEQQTFLREIPDVGFRETVRDFMVNQTFRRDYWVRGARRLNVLEQVEELRRQRVMLVQHRVDAPLKARGAIGEANLQAQIYGPILDALADHQPKTLGQIEQAVKDKGIALANVVQAVIVMSGTGILATAQDGAVIAKVRKQTDKLNAFLCDKARGGGDDNRYLASPVTGGGISVSRFPQLFLLAKGQGKKQPAEWASSVWQTLASLGQKVVKDGKTLETAEENVAELTAQAQSFAEKQLPIFRALGLA